MKSKKITNAYDSIQQNHNTYEKILTRTYAAALQKPTAMRHPVRRIVLIAACIALIAGISGIAYATHQKWSLPDPATLPISDSDVHREEYTSTDMENMPAPEERSDEYFIQTATEILHSVGLTDVDTSKMTVTREANPFWDREEAEVAFTEDEINTTLTFDAESGKFLSMTGIDWIDDNTTMACQTREEADALAQYYYSLLPVNQGYELCSLEEYDEQFWSYDFYRKITDDLYNPYECVRIAINPKSGRLANCVVFYAPLLDDHEPEDIPLTQAEAEEIASEYINSDKILKEAKLAVAMPVLTDLSSSLRSTKVSRLAWSLTYENPNSETADLLWIDIDYYTGEVLGIDFC